MYRQRYVATPTQIRRMKADIEAFRTTTKELDRSVGKDIKAFEDMRDLLIALGFDLERFKANANLSKQLSQQWQEMKSSTPPADVERQKMKFALDRLSPSFYSNVVSSSDELIKAIANFVRLFDVEGGYTVDVDN